MRCPSCDLEIGSPDFSIGPHHCPCGFVQLDAEHGSGADDLAPSLLAKGIHYIAAWRKWTLSGRPRRSEEAIRQIRDICARCEHYKRGGCNLCGCPVNEAHSILGDKVEWATERCPIDKWS